LIARGLLEADLRIAVGGEPVLAFYAASILQRLQGKTGRREVSVDRPGGDT